MYFMLEHRVAYHDIGAAGYESRQRERALAHLQRMTAKLGFDLTIPWGKAGKDFRKPELPMKLNLKDYLDWEGT